MRSRRLPWVALAFAGLSAGATAGASFSPQQSPGITVVSPPLTVESLELAVDRLLEARWYPPDPQATMKALTDRRLLQTALASQDGAVRAVAVRSLGRFENASDLMTLVAFLKDVDSNVRHEAAHAIVLASRRGTDSRISSAIAALVAMQPPDAAILEALSLGRYTNPLPPVVESLSTRWLERVIRANPSVKLSTLRLKALHDSVRVGSPYPDADALEILLRQSDGDVGELWYSAQFRCPDPPNTPLGSCGWQVRFVPAQLLEPNDSSLEPILTRLAADPIFQVRLAAVRQLALAIPRTHSCRPLLNALADSSEVPVVKVEAIRQLDRTCEERVDIVSQLALVAEDLGGWSGAPPWVATRALEALPRFDAAQALRLVKEQAVSHPLAMVRASAGRVAAALKDEATLVNLATDADDGVRSEAIGGLATIRSPRTMDLAIRGWDSKDHRLIATAAAALTRPLDPEKTAAALAFTLNRLTREGKDTSREARLAILTRLDELARIKAGDVSMLISYAEDLVPLLKDFDPPVAEAAASTLSIIRGTRQYAQAVHRPPQQPRDTELRSLPTTAAIVMANGDHIDLELLRTEAPITLARFVKLARDHYYDNTEFFRISPLVVAQGGSPGGNDYSGDARFVRDEIGLEHHQRGSVGLMTHGRDTGNMQFFIDLMDQPGFDHEYTVFARVKGGLGPHVGMAAVDAIVEGSKIAQVTVGIR